MFSHSPTMNWKILGMLSGSVLTCFVLIGQIDACGGTAGVEIIEAIGTDVVSDF